MCIEISLTIVICLFLPPGLSAFGLQAKGPVHGSYDSTMFPYMTS